jgi:hypothetical protein
MAAQLKTRSITAENQYTDWMQVIGDKFRVSISGTWSATVTVQCSFDEGKTPLDVESFTSNVQKSGEEPESGVRYRVGVKTGNFTSGPVEVRISQ